MKVTQVIGMIPTLRQRWLRETKSVTQPVEGFAVSTVEKPITQLCARR